MGRASEPPLTGFGGEGTGRGWATEVRGARIRSGDAQTRAREEVLPWAARGCDAVHHDPSSAPRVDPVSLQAGPPSLSLAPTLSNGRADPPPTPVRRP